MTILIDASAAALHEATEANYAEFFTLYMQVPHIQQRHECGITRLTSRNPADYLNTVLRTQAENGIAATCIHEIMTDYKTRRTSVRWHVWPSSQPSNLTDLLDGEGLRCTRDIPCMALELSKIAPLELSVSDLEIEQIADLGMLYDEMYSVSYDLFFCLAYEMGLRSTSPVLHFVARRNGEPAATASVYLGAGVAGLYDVVTMPHMREKGIGTAICTAALQKARDMGYQYAVLQSSHLGYRIYQRLGFEEIGRLLHYNWYDFYGDF